VKRLGLITFTLVALAASVAMAVSLAGPAQAINYPADCSWKGDGRCLNQGYFSGLNYLPSDGWVDVLPQYWTYDDPSGGPGAYSFPPPGSPLAFYDGMPPGVAAQHFIAFIDSYLNAPNPGGCVITNPNPPVDLIADNGNDFNSGCWAWRREVLGAAFIVLTMLGGDYTAYPGTPSPPTGPRYIFNDNVATGVNVARSQFATWSTLVTEADQNGNVKWDVISNQPPGHLDSTSDDFAHDVTVFRNEDAQNNPSIVFSSGSGNYVIDRVCANTNGLFTPLQAILNFKYVPGISVSAAINRGAWVTTTICA